MPDRWIDAGRAPVISTNAGQSAMPVNAANDDPERARRFRDAALPHLDDVYTLARYLLRDAADAEDAVQECYLRALKHFDSYRGPAMKPWLFAILRNVCYAEYARRKAAPTGAIEDAPEPAVAWLDLVEACLPAESVRRPAPGFRPSPPPPRYHAPDGVVQEIGGGD